MAQFKSPTVYQKPDPRYKSMLITKLVNEIMRDGKKSVARKLIYKALDTIQERVDDKSPLEVFEQAVANVKPLIEVRSRRVGGMTYQVPTEVPPKRQVSLAMRWMWEAASSKKGRPMHQRLADEILDSYRKQGTSYQRRENAHKMAEANRAFAHFRIR